MYSNALNALISELGRLINIPNLKVDETGFCIINYPAMGFSLELTADSSFSFLKIFLQLGDVNRGRYREEVLHEALRANYLPFPRYGNFGYNSSNNQLVLWDLLPLKELSAADLAEYLTKFLPKGFEVKQALETNTVPSLTAKAAVKTGSLYGLH